MFDNKKGNEIKRETTLNQLYNSKLDKYILFLLKTEGIDIFTNEWLEDSLNDFEKFESKLNDEYQKDLENEKGTKN